MQVYALVASDEPLQVRYVGSTVGDLARRLGRHVQQAQNVCLRGPKFAWIRSVLARGATVEIVSLSHHSSKEQLPFAEHQWIEFWRQYCDLLNNNRCTWRRGVQDYPRHTGFSDWRKSQPVQQQ